MDRRAPVGVLQQRVLGVADQRAVGEDHPLVAQRQRELDRRHPVRDRVQRPAQPARAAPPARRPSAWPRTSARTARRRRSRRPDARDQLAQRPAREQHRVRRQVAPPARARELRGRRRRVGRDDAEHAAGPQQRRALRRSRRPDRRGARARRRARSRRSRPASRRWCPARTPPAATRARRARSTRACSAADARELEPHRLVAALARLVEQQPVPAADVEQPPARPVRADQVEQAVRGRAPAHLLGEVVVVAHLAVEVVQRVAGRQDRLLDRPALEAAQQVAVLADARARRARRRQPSARHHCPARAAPAPLSRSGTPPCGAAR